MAKPWAGDQDGAGRLVLAVLLDGLMRSLGANPELVKEAERAAQQAEAQAWLAARRVGHDADDSPFTFTNACETLGLDPQAVRRAVAAGVCTLDALAVAASGLLTQKGRKT